MYVYLNFKFGKCLIYDKKKNRFDFYYFALKAIYWI